MQNMQQPTNTCRFGTTCDSLDKIKKLTVFISMTEDLWKLIMSKLGFTTV